MFKLKEIVEFCESYGKAEEVQISMVDKRQVKLKEEEKKKPAAKETKSKPKSKKSTPDADRINRDLDA